MSQDRSTGTGGIGVARTAGGDGGRRHRRAGWTAARGGRSRLISIVIIAVVIAGGTWWKLSQRDNLRGGVYSQAIELIQAAPGFDERPQEYVRVVERAHFAAFDQAFEMGGRRSNSKFDENRYLTVLFDRMIDDAKRARDEEMVADLETLRMLVVSAEDGPGSG